jgi:foldase protein PrsA
MRRIISPLFLLFLIFCAGTRLYAQDKIIAVVNDEVITQKDLNDFLNFIRVQYSRQLSGRELEEKVNSAKHDLLQRLIEDRLMLQQAKIDKVSAEPSRVKGKMDEIKKRYPTESDFERDLATQGLVQADLENKIRDQILTFGVIEKKVRSKVMVRPDEVTDFYNQNKEMFVKPQQRMLTVIALQDEDSAKSLCQLLRKGDKLGDLSGKYAFTVSSLSVSEGQDLRSEISDKVFSLGRGEISDPVSIDGQYYIFRLDDIIESRPMSLAESQEKIQAYLFDKKLQERMSKWLDELKTQSYIKIFEN